jgi:hypothetical protein
MPRTTAKIGTPGFIADLSSMESNDGRQIDWDHVDESYRQTAGTAPVIVTVGAAGAAQGAVAVPVDALSGAIPSGTVLNFGGAKFARLTAGAAAGAVALAVAAIPTALVDNDTATYAGVAGSGSKVLLAGTAIGELLGSGKISPRVAVTNPATGILKTTAIEDDPSAASSGYGVFIGGGVYEALLPQASGSPRTIAQGIKDELVDAGCTFKFLKYADNTAS